MTKCRMKIAGLQKLSLVDFPGRLAAAVFVQGCNFRCGYCQNPGLISTESPPAMSEEEVLDFLDLRKKVIEGLVITGGEPTIYKDLPDLVRRVKAAGVAVKLDTNGSNPEQIRYLLTEGLLDYIAVDIKTSISKYPSVAGRRDAGENISASIGIVMSGNCPYEFRTTCVPGVVGEEDIRLIGETVKGAKKYCLQQFNPSVTYDENFGKIKPYKPADLKRFKSILEAYVEEVEIRGA
ncbi:MAG: anaerobic ribonucleoside-triphosphate reductase activating protein [Candidatus Omnitrophota bacterium]